MSVDYTPATVVTLTFAFDFTTTPQVLLCLGRGVFSFAFVAWCICGWALVVFPPNVTTGAVLVPIYDKHFATKYLQLYLKRNKVVFLFVAMCHFAPCDAYCGFF